MSDQVDPDRPKSSNGSTPSMAHDRDGDAGNRGLSELAPREDAGGVNPEKEHEGKISQTAAAAAAADDGHHSAQKKKRRKVNHACIYCRRSHMTCDLERPCARCIKRDIGHLCRDEPREPSKRSKSESEPAPVETKSSDSNAAVQPAKPFDSLDGSASLSLRPSASAAGAMAAPPIVQPKQVSPRQLQKQPVNPQNASFGDWTLEDSNQFHDMHNLHPNYTFNTSEITNEYNLLGDFLSSSLLDDGALYNGDDAQALFNDPLLATNSLNTFTNNMPGMSNQSNSNQSMAPPQTLAASDMSRPSSTFPIDTRARDKFYMTAADPAGNDTPEERMNKLLKAKYDAGMLKPFNYVKGYARLNKYMEENMRPISRHKILRQLERFRPKFREKMHTLTDMQLVFVEMWFERTLMEYDRVFASMAIPACCWRRTGEIYRGNREMAELIHRPIEELRDVSATSQNTTPPTLSSSRRVNWRFMKSWLKIHW